MFVLFAVLYCTSVRTMCSHSVNRSICFKWVETKCTQNRIEVLVLVTLTVIFNVLRWDVEAVLNIGCEDCVDCTGISDRLSSFDSLH